MLILASKSLIRKEILAQAGVVFVTDNAVVNEREIEAEERRSPLALAQCLAGAKAAEVSLRHPHALVLGADQVLEANGSVLHKPDNLEEAHERLARLSGQSHHLHTACALAKNGDLLWQHGETATLVMRDFDRTEIARILALEGEKALQSVGAYRLEGPALQLFESLHGDYFAMLGLPLLPLLNTLRRLAPEALEFTAT